MRQMLYTIAIASAVIKSCAAFNFTLQDAAFFPVQSSFNIGDVVSITWVANAVNNFDIAGTYQQCYIAIRPLLQESIDGAIVTDTNNQEGADPAYCSKGVYSFTIPSHSINKSIALDGSYFMIRINTLNQTNGYNTQTTAFRIYTNPPPDKTYDLAQKGYDLAKDGSKFSKAGAITGAIGAGTGILSVVLANRKKKTRKVIAKDTGSTQDVELERLRLTAGQETVSTS